MTAPERPDDCIFCKIVEGEIPAEIVHADETTVAFRDVNPQAPTHVLVIPRSHYENAAELARHEPASVAAMVSAGSSIAATAPSAAFRRALIPAATATTDPRGRAGVRGTRSGRRRHRC